MTRTPRGLVVAVGLWGAAAAAFGLPAPAWSTSQTIADEPQYLLSALSLAEDGNLDISDELAAERWRAFHRAELPEQTRPLPDGRRVSPHDPLLPLLLAPGMAAAGWVGAKATLALIAGVVAALTCWLAIARLRVRPGVAAGATAVFAGAMPLAPYGSHVYPELPSALAVLLGVAVLTGTAFGRWRLWAVGAAVVALPWLAVKHAAVAAVLAALGLLRLVREGRRGAALGLVLGLAAAGAVYLALHQLVWTGWTVYASGDHFVERGELSVVGFAPDYWGRTRRLVGLLVDARYGIAAWQPAWLLAVPAVAALAAARGRASPARPLGPLGPKSVLLAPLAAGWATATWVALTMHGFWAPGRQLVVVLPLAVLAVAWWVDRVAAARRLLWVLGAVGVAAHAWLAVEAAIGGVTWVRDFWATTFPPYRAWRLLLPDYAVPASAGMWLAHGIWTAAAVAAAAFGWRHTPRARPVASSARDQQAAPLSAA